jgi:GrpB-like predicted nucleotidyltransferase (UPF0157 family)
MSPFVRHRLFPCGWQFARFSAGSEAIDRMLAFRDWLRAHEEDRRHRAAENGEESNLRVASSFTAGPRNYEHEKKEPLYANQIRICSNFRDA